MKEKIEQVLETAAHAGEYSYGKMEKG